MRIVLETIIYTILVLFLVAFIQGNKNLRQEKRDLINQIHSEQEKIRELRFENTIYLMHTKKTVADIIGEDNEEE